MSGPKSRQWMTALAHHWNSNLVLLSDSKHSLKGNCKTGKVFSFFCFNGSLTLRRGKRDKWFKRQVGHRVFFLYMVGFLFSATFGVFLFSGIKFISAENVRWQKYYNLSNLLKSKGTNLNFTFNYSCDQLIIILKNKITNLPLSDLYWACTVINVLCK